MSNPLGRVVPYSEAFDPGLLFGIERDASRNRNAKWGTVECIGVDRWTCYELSWLNEQGVPQVAIATIEYPSDTPCLVESKSLKLFLGSMNFTIFPDIDSVADAIRDGLGKVLGSNDIVVSLHSPDAWSQQTFLVPPGECLDSEARGAGVGKSLVVDSTVISEVFHSNLLRSLCPVTSQPDWGTVIVSYSGRKILRSSMLEYLIAHRGYQGYHEECCERIFCDIAEVCQPSTLWVGCFYTRRGGVDINPERWIPGSTRPEMSGRLPRQ